jgi:hypothetical protein
MNSIIILSDGAGTTIENGTITTNTIDISNLNVNNIQGKLPADNILLYTDTTGNIDLGKLTSTTLNMNGYNSIYKTNNTTSIISLNDLYMESKFNAYIDSVSGSINMNASTINIANNISSVNVNIGNATGTTYLTLNSKSFTGIYSPLATGSIDLQANVISLNSGNGKTVFLGNIKTTASGITTNGITDFSIGASSFSGKLKITGAQQIEPNVIANGLTIGADITSTNLILGNSTYPPICNATATAGKQICNYDTVVGLIGGAGILSTNNVWTGTNDFSQRIKTDEIQTYTVGGTLLITATAMTCNAITLAMNSAITFNDFVNVNELTPKTGAIDMYLWTAQANLTNIWLGSLTAANTGITNIAQNNGLINIGISNTRAANINIGSGTSFSGAINIANQSGLANTVRIGANTTTTLLLRGTAVTLSGTNAALNHTTTTISSTTTSINTGSGTVNLGGGTTVLNVAGATTNLNSTTINIGGASTTSITLSDPINPSYVYSATTGTNVVGTIGYIYTQATPTPANGTGWGGSPSAQTYASISVEAGVYIVDATMTILGAGTTNLQQVQASIGTGTPTTEYINRILQVGGASSTLYYSISGVVSLATATTINCALYIYYSGGAPLLQHTGFKYRITRIA